jgi:hypothetical protein
MGGLSAIVRTAYLAMMPRARVLRVRYSHLTKDLVVEGPFHCNRTLTNSVGGACQVRTREQFPIPVKSARITAEVIIGKWHHM